MGGTMKYRIRDFQQTTDITKPSRFSLAIIGLELHQSESEPNFDLFERRGLTVARGSSELAGLCERTPTRFTRGFHLAGRWSPSRPRRVLSA
jgi:hypothetical protein